MNKEKLALLAVIVPGATVVALGIFFFSPSLAQAYSVDTVATPTAIGQNYDFGNSFKNLVSPFTSFFNNMKTTNGTISISVGSSTTVNVDTQPYVNRFDSWFYGFTGVNIVAFTNGVTSFFSWLFDALHGVVIWIASLFGGMIK